jgi:hypothetical protein
VDHFSTGIPAHFSISIYTQLGFILKKIHPRYKPRRYGCKTLGTIYEKLDGYEVVQTAESGTVIRRKQDNS